MPTQSNQNASNQHHYTIAVIGRGCAGKTSYINRMKTGEFITSYLSTNYSTYSQNLTFYTSLGTINTNIMENDSVSNIQADAFILIFDLTKTSNWNIFKIQLDQWYYTIKQTHGDVPIILCGNKCDLLGQPVISNSKISAIKKDMIYYPISAKSNYNFEKPFLAMFKNLINPDLELVAGPAVTPSTVTL